MSEQVIPIHSDLDVMKARMQVRNAAHHIGMNTADQARISLATTSIAYSLGLGNGHEGEVMIECIDRDGRQGVQVTCTETGSQLIAPNVNALQKAKWMVDEVTLKKSSATEVRVCLIKWLVKVMGL